MTYAMTRLTVEETQKPTPTIPCSLATVYGGSSSGSLQLLVTVGNTLNDGCDHSQT